MATSNPLMISYVWCEYCDMFTAFDETCKCKNCGAPIKDIPRKVMQAEEYNVGMGGSSYLDPRWITST